MEREKTAVVLNDELGGMAYAFQRAGFQVLCDVVPNENSMEIAEKNLQDKYGIQIRKVSEETYLEIPSALILVGKIKMGPGIWSRKMVEMPPELYENKNFYRYIEKCEPQLFCMEAPNVYAGYEEWRQWEQWCISHGYKIKQKILDIGKITGLPIREERRYIVGSKGKTAFEFFGNGEEKSTIPWNAILDETPEEPFIEIKEIKNLDYEGDGIYDWRGLRYRWSQTVSINTRFPLLVENGKARYLSVREIARLKGYPDKYDFSGVSKSVVRDCLRRSVNVYLYCLLAEQIRKTFFEECAGNETEIPRRKSRSTVELEGDEMERRFDVFVSSTYEDLIEERKEITQAVLECDCMPVGMEMFPASNLEQWEFIKKVIDKADIYLVVIAGKYGTPGRDENGKPMSYTEMEFNYALASGKPILAFEYKNIDKLTRDKVELDGEKAKALEVFRKKVQKDRIVKFYSNKDELKAHVLASLNNMKKQITTGGWIRANQSSFDGKKELEEKVRKLESNQERWLQEKRQLEEEREKILLQLNEVKAGWLASQERENTLKKKYENALLKVGDFSKKVDAVKEELSELSEEMSGLKS